MCGILGLVVDNAVGFGNSTRNQSETLSLVLDKLMVESTTRGSHSAGVAAVTKDFKVGMLKKPMPGRVFVNDDTYKEWKKDFINDNTRIVIGHTRAQTKGTYENNFNNHPIHNGLTIGVHNGMINNDEYLWTNAGNPLRRRGQVDSEVIFHLIDQFAQEGDYNITDAIYEASTRLVGSYACAMFHMKKPKYLWLFQKGNAVYVYNTESTGFKIFASDERFIRDALGVIGMGLIHDRLMKIKYGFGLRIDANSGKIKRIALNTRVHVGSF